MPRVSADYWEARKRDIIDAAAVCFAKKGFHATSMQDIFGSSGVSAGAFYRYFNSKAELIAALAEETAMLLSNIVGDAAARSASRREFITVLLEEIDAFERRTGRAQLAVQVWSEAARDEAVRRLVLNVMDQTTARIASAVGSEPLARVVLAVVQGFVVQRAWGIDSDAALFARTAGTLAAETLN